MVRVHRSGSKYEFNPPHKQSIKTRKSRRLSSLSSSKPQAINSFPHGAVKITKPAKKPSPPPQSRANSVTGIKASVKEPRPPPFPVPMLLYSKIQKTLEIIKSMETNPSEEHQLNLDSAVIGINNAATFYDWCLPPDWKFDPTTASTIEWQLMVSDDEDDDDPISVEENPCVEFPDIHDVSLNPEQYELWLEFKKSDENTPTIYGINLGRLEETASSIPVNHPYVQSIGAFAVDSYNKALDMLVKDKHNYLKRDEVISCYYHKMSSEYWFHMIIKATEEEEEEEDFDFYATKVQVFTNDGRITLCTFFRPGQAREGKRLYAIPFSATYHDLLCVNGWSNPALCYRATGLIRRNACEGYDFYSPFDIDRLWI